MRATWQAEGHSFGQASGWASALRVTALPEICVTQYFGDDMDSWTRPDLLTPKEFTRRAHAQPLAIVLILDATFQPHSMIRADVLCDSSVALVANAVECERPS